MTDGTAYEAARHLVTHMLNDVEAQARRPGTHRTEERAARDPLAITHVAAYCAELAVWVAVTAYSGHETQVDQAAALIRHTLLRSVAAETRLADQPG
jgi:hypothetical protein